MEGINSFFPPIEKSYPQTLFQDLQVQIAGKRQEE